MTNMVSDPDSGDPGANQVPSQIGGVQPSSPVSPDLNVVLKQLDAINAQLRTLQSGKDRGVAQVSKKVENLSERLAKYEEYRARMNPVDAARQLEIDDLLAERYGTTETPSGQQAPGSAPADSIKVDSELLAVLGIDAKDPAVTEMLLEGKNTPADFIALAKSKRQQTTIPATPGSVMPVSSGSAATSQENAALLRNEYLKEMGENRGNMTAINQIKKKYREKGLPDVY